MWTYQKGRAANRKPNCRKPCHYFPQIAVRQSLAKHPNPS
jgi:hypothetical protein